MSVNGLCVSPVMDCVLHLASKSAATDSQQPTVEKWYKKKTMNKKSTDCAVSKGKRQTFESVLYIKQVKHPVEANPRAAHANTAVVRYSCDSRHSLVLGLKVLLYKAVTYTRLLIWELGES